MGSELPKIIEARRLRNAGATVAGEFPSRHLQRVAWPYEALSAVQARFTCEHVDHRGIHVEGNWQTTVTAVCQRCLAQFEMPLAGEFSIVLGDGTELIDTETDDSSDDWIELVDEAFDGLGFVEDEILLACPMIPMHDDENCSARETDALAPSSKRRKPFADLAQMLEQKPNK